ncbi:MAG: nicotinate phosphoribosyltransferase [Actinomycetota bacterium]
MTHADTELRRQHRAVARGLLFTDQYQLTMAQLYHRLGLHEREARFEHFTRRTPHYGSHQAGYCVSAGLDPFLDWLVDTRLGDEELAALRAQVDGSGRRRFDDPFLDWLAEQDGFGSLSIDAVAEGRVVHPNVPMTVVTGPLAMAQIVETALLNQLNYATLVATKASRVVDAARGRPVLEFGLRRAPGWGANAAARAALIGGAVGSSNVGASHLSGVDPMGTHAHSMVQAFMALGEGELGAFRAYADVYPDECLLLVDTIDTLKSGVPNAITVFDELKRAGHEPVGIRLDSGDLAYLSIQAARLLDEAGFPDVAIVLSSGLDEIALLQILAQIDAEAPRYGVDPKDLVDRLAFGVGSKMATSDGQPYLDGVYKLMALREGDAWVPAMKISESPSKTQNPGDKDVYRLYDQRGRATADLLTVAGEQVVDVDPLVLQHPILVGTSRQLRPPELSGVERLVDPVVERGRRLHDPVPIEELRSRHFSDVERLDPGVRRLVNPHEYHVSLSPALWDLKQGLIAKARNGATG